MGIKQTRHGTWQVRWRDSAGRQRAKTFKDKRQADAFAVQATGTATKGLDMSPNAEWLHMLDPLWLRTLRRELGPDAAVDVGSVNPNGHFVYLLWGTSDDRPLYVGRSSNVLARVGSHMNDPKRRHRIARVTLVRCLTAAVAAETEARLIDLYDCELNLLDGNGRRIVDRPL